ncbi:hypothetical protein niasHT_018516 [Heterodera trifolii]|uniref:polynucleotide adenylyltransferase n=1 Tax=Heterodera trifolii TaxID=157864 RepID=A0ABD2LBB9_9BILA
MCFWMKLKGKKSDWDEITELEEKGEEENNKMLCLIYQNGAQILKMMLTYIESDEGIREKWKEYLDKHRVLDIIEIIDPVDCDDTEINARISMCLLNEPLQWHIIGQNFYEFLENSAELRHFMCMCNKIANYAEIKIVLGKMIGRKYLTLLDDEFPEIMRADVLLSTTGLMRIKRLMAHRSGTERHTKELLRFVTVQMLMEMRMLPDNLQSQISERKGPASDEATLSARLQSPPGFKLLIAKANTAAADALRNFGSPFQLCVLIKIANFALAPRHNNSIDALTERMVKKLRTDECENGQVQEQILGEEMTAELGAKITVLIAQIASANVAKFRRLFTFPGTKTRLLRLVGSSERMKELDNKIGLAQKFAENEPKNDELIWTHYLFVMLTNHKIEVKSHKIGADLAVFMHFLGQAFSAGRHMRKLFRLISDYISDQIYDPIFDSDESELNEIERFLREKMFLETKKMVEKLSKDDNVKASIQFKKWEVIVKRVPKKGTENGKEMEKIGEWIGQLHQTKLSQLIRRNNNWKTLKNIIQTKGTANIRQKLLNLFDANAVESVFEEFDFKNISEATGDIRNSFDIKWQLENSDEYGEFGMMKEEEEESYTDEEEKEDEEEDDGAGADGEAINGTIKTELAKLSKKVHMVENIEQWEEHLLKEKQPKNANGEEWQKRGEEKREEEEEEEEGRQKGGERRIGEKGKGKEEDGEEEKGKEKEDEAKEEKGNEGKAKAEYSSEKADQTASSIKISDLQHDIKNLFKKFEIDQQNYWHVECPEKTIEINLLREEDRKILGGKRNRQLAQTFLHYIYSEFKPENTKEISQELLSDRKMEMQSLCWFLVEAVIFLFVEAKAMKEPQGSKFDTEIYTQMILFEELVNGMGSRRKIEQIYTLWQFRNFMLMNKRLWKNSEKWRKFIAEEYGINWDNDETELVDRWNEVAFDSKEAIRIFSELRGNGKIEQIQYIGIGMLIGLSKEIQRYYCNLSKLVKMESAKKDLADFIGPEMVIKLEEKFPEILKIEFPEPTIQAQLFQNYLKHKTGTYQQIIALARFAFPFHIYFAKTQIEEMPKNAGADQNIETLHKALGHRLNKLLLDYIYPAIGRSDQRIWALCVLEEFRHFTTEITPEKSQKANKGKKKIIEKEIREWNADAKCADIKGQLMAFQERQILLEDVYNNYLTILIKNDCGHLKKFIMETRGARTRLWKLIGGKKQFEINFRKELSNKQVFDDKKLKSNYLEALFSGEYAAKVVAKLSCFISVLVRWVDSEVTPANPNRSIGLRQIGELVWPTARRQFEFMYDAFADVSFEELAVKSQLVREMAKGLRDFLEAKRHEKSAEKLDTRPMVFTEKGKQKEHLRIRSGKITGQKIKTDYLLTEYQQMADMARQRASQMALNEGMEDEADEGLAEGLEQWLRMTHWDTLLVLLQDDAFRGNLNKGLMNEDNAKDRLEEFIGAEKTEKAQLLLSLNGEEYKGFVKEMKEKEKFEKSEKEKERNKKKREEADEIMRKLIEEERIKEELKKRMEEIQREKKERRLKQRELQRMKEKETEMDNGEGREQQNEDREASEGSQSEENSSSLAESFVITPKSVPKERKNGIFENKEQNGEKEKKENDLLFGREEWQNESGKTQLIDFTSDQFLHEKIYAFLQNRSETKKHILDIGVFVNELWQRMEMIRQLSKFEGKLEMERAEIAVKIEKMAKIDEKWTQMKRELMRENLIRDRTQFEGVISKMYRLLKQMISIGEAKELQEEKEERNMVANQWATVGRESNAEWKEDTVEDGEKAAIKSVKIQLHKNKLAKAIVSKEKRANENEQKNTFWEMDREQKSEILMELFDYERRKTNMISRFEEHLEGWRKLEEQQEIDRNLRGQKNVHQINFDFARPHLEVNFPEISQQIRNDQLENIQQKNMFTDFIKEIPKNDTKSLGAAFDTLKSIIEEWSNGTARLIVSGSHLLGTRTADSDIDAICVVPQKESLREKRAKFLGTFNCVLTIQREKRICTDNSLHCQFCKHANVEYLTKFPSVHIHLIKLKLLGVEFDLSLVSVPDMELLPDEPLEAVDVELMMEVLANQRVPSEVMLKTLAGYLDSQQMIGLIAPRKMPKFRSFVIALKHWAKRSHIYGNIFGFFTGAILSVLAAKVILWYPNASLPFLFQKFMLLFSTWNWPMPVKLTQQMGTTFDAFAWNTSADGQKGALMPIITPGKLAQNCAINVNESTIKILQNEMREAHSHLTKGTAANFGQLFPPRNFVEKFDHFLVISCIVSQKGQIGQFCDFVQRKIRQYLANLDQILKRFVHYSQVNPAKNGTDWAHSDNKCPEKMRQRFENIDSPLCKFWIVGLKIKEENFGTDHGIFMKEINENLEREFDAKIHKEYVIKVLKGWMQQMVKLETKYVKGEELAEFL